MFSVFHYLPHNFHHVITSNRNFLNFQI